MALEVPGRMAIECIFQPGPNAVPASSFINAGPGQLKVLSVGGYTKLEDLAGKIAAKIISESFAMKSSAGGQAAFAAVAVDIAAAILAECQRRQSPPATN